MIPSSSRKYAVAARLHGVASRQGDHRTANRAHKELMKALREMRSSADGGVAVLRDLLKDEDSFVVCWAATHLIPLDAILAREALQALSKNPSDLASFDASMVLREWDAGRLKIGID